MKPDKHPPKPPRRVYPDELKQEAVQMLLDGHSAPSVARNLGIRHTSLLYRWKAEHREFREATKQGKAVADDMVVSALFRRATGYSHDAVKHMVVSDGRGEGSHVEAIDVVEHVPPDTTAAIFWLKNRRPKEWRDRQEVQHEAGDTIEPSVSVPMARAHRLAAAAAPEPELEPLGVRSRM